MEKICTRCKASKPTTRFNKRGNGLSSWCRDCYSEYDRNRYVNGDKERKDKNRADRVTKVREGLWKILLESECKVCGNSDPEVLEFDHREQSNKQFNISEMIRSYSWDTIQSEIDKCDILCANCHRKRTIKQLGLWRGQMGVA